MSGFKPVGAELLYAYHGAATTSTPTTSPGGTITATYPPIVIPAGYMDKVGSWSSSLQMNMGALMTTTATIPTWRFVIYAAVATTTAPAFSTSGITLADTGTFTPPSAVSNSPVEFELNIGLRAIAPGAASTVIAWGRISGTILNSAGYVPFPAAGAYTPPSTWDTTQSYILWPALILGAATAGNTVTVEYCKLYGES